METLQAAVQWVVDEDRIMANDPDAERSLTHDQDLYTIGYATDQKASGYRVICPTACCLAGNIVIAHGDLLIVNYLDYDPGEQNLLADYCLDSDGRVHHVQERAAELVGIDPDPESFDQSMFDGDQNADDIRALAEATARRHGWDGLDIK